MSILDWIEVHNARTHSHVIPGMTGSLNLTIGDAVSGIYGANHTHVYGGDIKLLCDPEDFLVGKLAHSIPGVCEALVGIGGNASFVYAQETSALYGGPKVEIRRAHAISKTSDNILPRVGGGAAPHGHDPHGHDAPPSPVDKTTCAAVAAMSIMIIGLPAACELLIRFKYGDSHDHMPELLKLGVVGLTSRLMDVLKLLEESGTWGDMAVIAADRGEHDLERVQEVMAGPLEMPGVVEELALEGAEDVEDAAEAAAIVAELLEGAGQDDAAELM